MRMIDGRIPSGDSRATPQAAPRLDHSATIPCAGDMRKLAVELERAAKSEAEMPAMLRAPVLMELAEDAAKMLRSIASAIEAGTAETVQQGSVHESAVGNAETPAPDSIGDINR